jgi:predicted DNA-binding ArsR family transcriptional regulator
MISSTSFAVYTNQMNLRGLWSQRKVLPGCIFNDDDDLFEEKSHSKLSSSFRYCVNIENGHIIKIVFDLKTEDVKQMGGHAKIFRGDDTDRIKNIRKTGSTDFSAQGTVKAIVDADTGANLRSAETIGLIGSNWNTTRFGVPEDLRDKKYGDEATTFSVYPVKTREIIASRYKGKSFPDKVKFVVGEKSPVPVYQSTLQAFSTAQISENQYIKKMRGYDRNHSNEHIQTTSANLQKTVPDMKSKIESLKKTNPNGFQKYEANLEECVDEMEHALRKLTRKSNSSDDQSKWNQNKQSGRYNPSGSGSLSDITLLGRYFKTVLKKAQEVK